MNENKQRYVGLFVAIFLALVFGAGGMYYLAVKQELFSQTVVNKSEKEVTIDDKGIADAVEKLYDAVVVVQSYKGDRLIAGGTGFVYKVAGDIAYIITNSHVIDGADNVKVKFTNDQTEDVTIVGDDSYSDIAVLSLAKDKIIKVSALGKSVSTRLGDTVFAIGAPLGLEYSWTVTRGILSGKDRLIEINLSNSRVADWVMSVLQTDAAINSGNSGGPLANGNGEVIGVTNMKLISSGVEGMGFAIPIEDAVSTADQLIVSKTIKRPLLGVKMMNVGDRDLKSHYGITLDSSITSGAVIGEVVTGSAADEAGLKKGDVIIKFGDYKVTSSARLKYYLYKYKVGDKVIVTYIRGSKTETLTVNLSQKAS